MKKDEEGLQGTVNVGIDGGGILFNFEPERPIDHVNRRSSTINNED